jgi:hypothetical protein
MQYMQLTHVTGSVRCLQGNKILANRTVQERDRKHIMSSSSLYILSIQTQTLKHTSRTTLNPIGNYYRAHKQLRAQQVRGECSFG